MKIVERINNIHGSKQGLFLFLFLFPSKGQVLGLLLRESYRKSQLPQKKVCVSSNSTTGNKGFSLDFPDIPGVKSMPFLLLTGSEEFLALSWLPQCPDTDTPGSGNTPQIRAAKNKIILCWEGFHLNNNLLSLVTPSFPVALIPPSGVGKSGLNKVIY